MRIEHAVLEFEDTNIINLVGYNDSGKSAITRAVEVVLYDSYSNDQVNFIQDGKDYFKVTLTFDDGVVISKEKQLNGKSIWEMWVNNELVFTNNVNGNVVAVYNVPLEIASYLGVVEDENTNEKLNVRRRSDKLFLIETSGGDNYKILNTVLKVDILSDAFKRMNEDKNRVMAELSSLGVQRDTIKNEYESIKVMSENDELELQQLVNEVSNLNQKFTQLKHVYELYNLKESIIVFDELNYIETDKLNKLNHLQSLKREKEVEVWDELPSIDISRKQHMVSLMSWYKESKVSVWDELHVMDTDRVVGVSQLIKLKTEKELFIYDELGVCDIENYKLLSNMVSKYKEYVSLNNSFVELEEELENDKKRLKDVAKELNAKICNNCGTIVV